MNDNAKLISQVIAIFAGGWLVKNGIDNNQLEAAIGAVLTLAGAIFKFYHWNTTPSAPTQTPPPSTPSGIKLQLVTGLLIAGLFAGLVTGCNTTAKLQNGGAYAPGTTNADGTFTPSQQSDTALFIADSAYKLAYDAIDAVMVFEYNNRAQLQQVSPKIKSTLDTIRPQVVAVDHRWALARAAYKASPTPANLNTIQQILADIQRLVPVVQSQLTITSQ